MKSFISLTIYLLICYGNEVTSFTNPIVAHGPDPWMLFYDGYYYLATSTFTNKISMRKSKTIDGIHTATETTIYHLNGTGNMWAPEFHMFNSKWYIYYTEETKNGDLFSHRIHVLESTGTDPMGPYHFKVDLSDPKDDGFELDPSIIEISGKLYLLGSYMKSGQDLFIRAMSNPYTPSGAKILLSRPTNTWETHGGTVNEAPEPLHHNGKHFIVYSASFCETPDYSLGLLTFNGTDPLNPAHWHKTGPVFKRSDSGHVYGPGHNGFFKSPDGKEDWIVYHANDNINGRCDMNRSTRVQKFTWNEDGTPNFGIPAAAGVKLEPPSGE